MKTKKKEKGGKKDDKKKKRKASSSEEDDKQESEETQEAKKHRTDRKDKTDKQNKKEAALKEEKQLRQDSKELQKKEALEAAYTSWRQGDVALFLADVTKHTDNMAGRDGAQFELEKVHGLANRTWTRPFGENGWLDATEAKSLLLKMKGLAEKTEAFLTSGTRASAGGSASG